MAVIRERTQVFSQPVGVRRVDTGEQEVWRSISRSAEVFSEISHQRAVEGRTKEAEEAALAVPTSELFVLDSETGEPAVLNTGENKGRVYAKTYERLINKRYINSIDTEIAEKALEIARRSPNSSVFKEEASRYVQNMVKASAPDGERTQYTTVIEDAGKAIVGKMFADMQDKERKAIAARVKRDNKLMVATKISKLEGLLEIGVDVSEDFNNLAAEVGDLWAAEAITADQIVRLDKIGQGLNALSSNPRLLSIYRGSSASVKSAIELGIREPFYLDNLVNSGKLTQTTATLIKDSLIGPASASDLITALTSSGELDKALDEEAYDIFKENNPVTMLTTLEHLQNYKAFGNEAYYTALQTKLNMSVSTNDVDSLAPKILALSNQTVNKQGLVDAGFTDANAEIILQLPFDDRKGLTDYLDNFRLQFSKVEKQERENKTTKAQTLINEYARTTSTKDILLFKSYNNNITNLKNMGLSPEDFNKFESQLFDEFSKKLQKVVVLPEVTLEELEQLNADIQSNASFPSFDATDKQIGYFILINELDETVRMRVHTKLVTQRRAELKQQDNERNISAAFTSIAERRGLSDDQRNALDDHLYGKGEAKRLPDIFELASIKDGEFLMNNENGFLTRLSNGDILPSELNGIISALQSTDSVNQNVAFDIMRQLYFAEQMSMDGTQSSRRNLLLTLQRNNENVFPRNLYNRVTTAMHVGNISLRKGISITPAEILNQIDRSDVNVEEVLRGTLGVSSSEIYSKYGPSASKSADKILPLMHPEARAQFAALMRYQAALGNPTNRDSLEDYFESFVNGLVEDDRILPEYRVGEHTEYSLDIMTSAQQNKIYLSINKQFEDDPDYVGLTETRVIDYTIDITSAALPFMMESKIRTPEIQKNVKFMPLRESFLTENKSWMVMVESDIENVFIPATPNGIPIIINSKDFAETDDRRSMLIQSYTNSIFSASHANQPKAVAVYELKLDIIRNPERYEQGNIFEAAKNLPMSGVFADQQLQGQVPKGKVLGVEFEGVTGPSLRVGITNKRVSNYLTAKEVEEVYDDTLEEIRGVE